MEMTPGEPTDDNRVGNFIKKLCECLNKAAETRQQKTEPEYKGFENNPRVFSIWQHNKQIQKSCNAQK